MRDNSKSKISALIDEVYADFGDGDYFRAQGGLVSLAFACGYQRVPELFHGGVDHSFDMSRSPNLQIGLIELVSHLRMGEYLQAEGAFMMLAMRRARVDLYGELVLLLLDKTPVQNLLAAAESDARRQQVLYYAAEAHITLRDYASGLDALERCLTGGIGQPERRFAASRKRQIEDMRRDTNLPGRPGGF